MPTSPYSITALHNEIHNDPASMGYAALVTAGDIGGLQALINSLSSPGARPVPHEDITGAAFLALVDPNELATLTIAQLQALQVYTGAADVSIGDATFQSWALGVFTLGDAPNSYAAIAAAASRTGSRAEVLWGTGTNVSAQDLEDASPF